LLAAQVAAPASLPSRRESYYHYCLSRQALNRHEFDEALKEMAAARAADPGSSELALEAARLELDVGDPLRAADAAREAAGRQAESADAARVLAEALLTVAMREGAGEDQAQAARQSLRDLQRLDPGNPDPPLDLARLELSRGRYTEALASVSRHLEM